MYTEMKKILYILLVSVVVSSCADALDSDKYFNDRRSLEDVFTDKENTEEWLANAYSYLHGNNAEIASAGANLTIHADDISFAGGRWGEYKQFKTGTYGEGFRQSWIPSYQGIRQASIFIQNVDMNTRFTEEERADLKAQARFVRAYYYWLLLRKYGPVPLLPDEGLDYTADYDDLAIPRNTYDECVEYIASEMVLAAKDLPLKRPTNQIARPTRGAALATRMRALLYAASPLANPRPDEVDKFSDLTNRDGSCLISQEYDEAKWARAAAAARDVMELNVYELYHKTATTTTEAGFPATVTPYDDGDFSTKTWAQGGYKDIDPYESYRAVFNGTLTMYQNPEFIFGRGRNQGGDNVAAMVRAMLPRTIANGDNCWSTTLKMYDTYYMSDGSKFSREAFKAQYPNPDDRFVSQAESDAGVYPHCKTGVYKECVNREPRFYASVAFNGSIWSCLSNTLLPADKAQPTEQQIFYYYEQASDGFTGTGAYLRTGIGVKKYVHPNDSNWGNGATLEAKPEVAIRYAEVLLAYAEALNELNSSYEIPSWDGQVTYSVSRDINEMKRGIRDIRRRAGIPDYTAAEYADADIFREKLRTERMIEFMGENQRYFDIRRWKIAEEVESQKIYGFNFYMSAEQRDEFFTPIECTDLPTAFSRKLYFWPIQHSELKRNKNLTQNPGWTYND